MEEKVIENIVEDTVVENVEGTVEDTVLDEVAEGASSDGSVVGAIIAGVITVFGVIGVVSTVKKIKSGIRKFIDKRKLKKAEKIKEAAIEDAQKHPENYYTEADVKEAEEVEEVKE